MVARKFPSSYGNKDETLSGVFCWETLFAILFLSILCP